MFKFSQLHEKEIALINGLYPTLNICKAGILLNKCWIVMTLTYNDHENFKFEVR